jgi:hypothetical protein
MVAQVFAGKALIPQGGSTAFVLNTGAGEILRMGASRPRHYPW